MPVRKLEPAEIDARVLAWLDLRAEAERPVLLFSGGPVRDDARWHVLAHGPRRALRASVEGGRARVRDEDGASLGDFTGAELVAFLRETEPASPDGATLDPGLPFRGGWIGYFGYDLAWLFEYGLPRFLPPDSRMPDLWLGLYDEPVVVDRVDGSAYGPEGALDELAGRCAPAPAAAVRVVEAGAGFHREEYEAAVARVREHCLCGDLFQADLSRRIALRIDGTPVDLFKRLVQMSPAPQMAYVGIGGGHAVVSASPEEFLRVRGRRARTRPIKGTRARGGTRSEDAALRDALIASEKDLAELTMIVDLMRNDLGRVARPGTVNVVEFPVLMTLPQVHHLFATIECELDARRDTWDLIASSFPPGSISGAPKAKAIEILEIVERSRRGVYTGAIGFVEPSGNAQLNVAIRTAEFAQGELRFGVGGGITALSDPEAEYEETMDKARGLAAALGLEELR